MVGNYAFFVDVLGKILQDVYLLRRGFSAWKHNWTCILTFSLKILHLLKSLSDLFGVDSLAYPQTWSDFLFFYLVRGLFSYHLFLLFWRIFDRSAEVRSSWFYWRSVGSWCNAELGFRIVHDHNIYLLMRMKKYTQKSDLLVNLNISFTFPFLMVSFSVSTAHFLPPTVLPIEYLAMLRRSKGASACSVGSGSLPTHTTSNSF